MDAKSAAAITLIISLSTRPTRAAIPAKIAPVIAANASPAYLRTNNSHSPPHLATRRFSAHTSIRENENIIRMTTHLAVMACRSLARGPMSFSARQAGFCGRAYPATRPFHSSLQRSSTANKKPPSPSPGQSSSSSSSSSSSMLLRMATFGVAGLAFVGVSNYLSDPSWRYEDDDGKTKDEPVSPQSQVTSQAFMDITIDGQPAGRIVLGLHGNVCPKTVQNFETLCRGDTTYKGIQLSYQNAPFHRIIPGFMIQGGDFTKFNGMGGRSMWGKPFADENFQLSHTGPGVLAMANAGPNTNSSQFYITTKRTSHLDGRHVVFGVVQEGWDLVKRIEQDCGTRSGKPLCKVMIAQAGILATQAQGTDDDAK